MRGLKLEANRDKGINSPPKWYDIYFKLRTSDQQQQQETLSKFKQSLPKIQLPSTTTPTLREFPDWEKTNP